MEDNVVLLLDVSSPLPLAFVDTSFLFNQFVVVVYERIWPNVLVVLNNSCWLMFGVTFFVLYIKSSLKINLFDDGEKLIMEPW